LEEAIYSVWTLAINRSVKPTLGSVLNQTMQDCIQIDLEITAFSIVAVVAAFRVV
jgi:hypothetical protein